MTEWQFVESIRVIPGESGPEMYALMQQMELERPPRDYVVRYAWLKVDSDWVKQHGGSAKFTDGKPGEKLTPLLETT